MGRPAARMTPGPALDRFFEAYYRRRPVTATFTGVHTYDHNLPDWSPTGLGEAADEMRAMRDVLGAAGLVGDDLARRFPDEIDLALADGFLEIQIEEHEGGHFYRGNPALWTGEAIFSVVSLVTRDFAPIADRLAAATSRLGAIPRFLADARETIVEAPAPWKTKALRECEAAEILFGRSLPAWFATCGAPSEAAAAATSAAALARDAFGSLAAWIAGQLPTSNRLPSVRRPTLDLLLRRGHFCETPAPALLVEAREALAAATGALHTLAAPFGGWPAVQARLAGSHPTPDRYLDRFAERWSAARDAAVSSDLVSWPEAPIRYVPIPGHTREAAPLLYYLFYRSPAAFDHFPTHDYVVTPVDAAMPEDEQERRLRAANDSVITLNHVIHHGGLGHHVQNWNAYRGLSRIGQVAAIDGASRIAMFCGGSLAEGWACYACDLMEEIGFLSPLERVSQQHTRVRLLARAVVDLSLHSGEMNLESAEAFYREQGLMPAAAGEAVKTSMFPGAAVMYWLGVRGVHDLRRACAVREGQAFSLRRFHDRFLSHGAIPVPLISRLMQASAAGATGA